MVKSLGTSKTGQPSAESGLDPLPQQGVLQALILGGLRCFVSENGVKTWKVSGNLLNLLQGTFQSNGNATPSTPQIDPMAPFDTFTDWISGCYGTRFPKRQW